MSNNLNFLHFDDLAEVARSRKGAWVTLRSEQTSANLVTRIRKGWVADIPSDEFQARSSRYSGEDDKSLYDIEIRWNGQGEVDTYPPTPSMTIGQFNAVLGDPGVQKAVMAALTKLGQ